MNKRKSRNGGPIFARCKKRGCKSAPQPACGAGDIWPIAVAKQLLKFFLRTRLAAECYGVRAGDADGSAAEPTLHHDNSTERDFSWRRLQLRQAMLISRAAGQFCTAGSLVLLGSRKLGPQCTAARAGSGGVERGGDRIAGSPNV